MLCSDTKTAVSSVSKSELNDLLSMLESSSLINLGKSREETNRKIQLNIQDTEILKMIESLPVLNNWLNEALLKLGVQ